jgi:hypothetical protein
MPREYVEDYDMRIISAEFSPEYEHNVVVCTQDLDRERGKAATSSVEFYMLRWDIINRNPILYKYLSSSHIRRICRS